MSVLTCQRIDEFTNTIDTGDVEFMEEALIAYRPEFIDYRCRLSTRTNRNDCTALGQCDRYRFSNAAETSGDYCNPTLEVTLGHYHSPMVGIDVHGSAGGKG